MCVLQCACCTPPMPGEAAYTSHHQHTPISLLDLGQYLVSG